MLCIKSFFFNSRLATTFSGADIDVWAAGSDNYWAVTKNGSSTISPQGFKNVNIHGIEAVGEVFCSLGSNRSVIVNNWAFTIQINGTVPLISGYLNVTNDFNVQALNAPPLIQLGRYYPKLDLIDPITSVSDIVITTVRASGIAPEDPTLINLNWNVNFIVKYSYEGEEMQFAFL